ncbi:type II toxin-antitoxin system RelE/ParE family toxin [Alcanivorax jadensis]|uniref:type II toxin-antitoxin system RelE/ParE family toxin n=1 Tax=Alcanivorax jadensis TaxID=64988 RepID=UPI00240A5147|nr:type II toxin-antitoxin system RelE/ParE family toxin [Alcanivorax jadensis]MDF1637833.1 type II toxin-antitoxin system RelE/ParE family toxin [Alcanivorax jadensis]
MKPLRWRPQASNDLDTGALWYAEQGGLPLGRAFIKAVEETTDVVSRNPASGSQRHSHLSLESQETVLRFFRVARFERYLIYYIEQPDHIDIVRIWNASRGLDALFDTDE